MGEASEGSASSVSAVKEEHQEETESDVCSYCEHDPVAYICQSCKGSRFCTTCVYAHTRKSHDILFAADSSSVEICQDHGMALDVFCGGCNKALCSKCSHVGSPSLTSSSSTSSTTDSHQTAPLPEVASERKNQLRDYASRCAHLKDSLDSLQIELVSGETASREEYRKSLKRRAKKMKAFINSVTEAELKVLDELPHPSASSASVTSCMSKLSENITTLEETVSKLNSEIVLAAPDLGSEASAILETAGAKLKKLKHSSPSLLVKPDISAISNFMPKLLPAAPYPQFYLAGMDSGSTMKFATGGRCLYVHESEDKLLSVFDVRIEKWEDPMSLQFAPTSIAAGTSDVFYLNGKTARRIRDKSDEIMSPCSLRVSFEGLAAEKSLWIRCNAYKMSFTAFGMNSSSKKKNINCFGTLCNIYSLLTCQSLELKDGYFLARTGEWVAFRFDNAINIYYGSEKISSIKSCAEETLISVVGESAFLLATASLYGKIKIRRFELKRDRVYQSRRKWRYENSVHFRRETSLDLPDVVFMGYADKLDCVVFVTRQLVTAVVPVNML